MFDFKDKDYILHQGDCLEIMKTFPDNSIQCCVTSPPYWGLRDYGHKNQIGLESTMQEYIKKMVDVFAEVHRVLCRDGTLWLNLGDGYCNNSKPGGGDPSIGRRNIGSSEYIKKKSFRRDKEVCAIRNESLYSGLKPKDLLMIPARVAIALQECGWYLRDDIIWHKPNPMPGSQKDRCTFAYEHIFMFSKSRKYYFDWESIAEPVKPESIARLSQDIENQNGSARGNGGNKTNGNMKAVASRPFGIVRNQELNYNSKENIPPQLAMKRNVWTIPTQPTKEAHFATFPEKLVEPCILAGTAPGDCVLDPFLGSGTTMMVSLRLGRKSIGIELNKEYFPIIHKRITPFTHMIWS